MMLMNGKISTVMTILKQPQYGLIASVSGIGFGLLYYYSTITFVPLSIANEMFGPPHLVASFSLTFIVAILAGVNVSLTVFKIKNTSFINMKKSSGSSALGSTLTVFTPGCPACTTSLTTVLAAVGGLSIFLLLGLEFKIISLGALLLSIYWISKSLNNSCNVEDKLET